MKTFSKFDKLLLWIGFLLVVGIFTLAFVMLKKGGLCVSNPVSYMINHNISFPSQYPRFLS